MSFDKINRGVLYMLFASFCFAIMGAFAKELAKSYQSVEIVFFRNIFGVFFILYLIYKNPLKQKGGKIWLLIFRGAVGFIALLAFFYNIATIPLAEAMTFSKTSPIFTAIFAFLFLGEKISLKGWLAICIGFIGVVLIINPIGMKIDKSDILGIFSAVGAALAYTAVRELREYYDTKIIVLSFMLIGSIGPLILMAISEFYYFSSLDFMMAKFIMPKSIDWIYILMMGIFATLAQFYMTKAYGVTKAGLVAGASYMNIIFSLFIGMLLGDAFPEMITIVGIFLVILGGILVAVDKN